MQKPGIMKCGLDAMPLFLLDNLLMAELLQNHSNLKDLKYSRPKKTRKIEKKGQKYFEGQFKD